MAAISVTAANVLEGANAKKRVMKAGETVTAGQVVYESGGKAYLAQSDGTQAEATAVGITLGGAGANQPVSVDIEDDDFTPGGTLVLTAAGGAGLVIVSATAGGIEMAVSATAPTSGQYPTIMGVAKTTTKMYLKIIGPGGPLTA
jgi:hypothetical protein